MTEENGATDRSMPPTETRPWEASDSNTQGYSSAPEELTDWPIDDLDDWPFDDPSVDVARLRESLREADADIAAGRTFGEDEIRTRYGLPRK